MKPNTTDSCEPLRGELKAYADNELPFLTRARVRAHLRHCANCQTELNEMNHVTELLQTAENAVPAALPTNLRSRVLSRIAETAPAFADQPTATKPLWKRQPLLVFGGGGASVAASLLIFSVMYGPAQNASRDMMAAKSASSAGAAEVASAPMPPPAAPQVETLSQTDAAPANSVAAAAPAAAKNAPMDKAERRADFSVSSAPETMQLGTARAQQGITVARPLPEPIVGQAHGGRRAFLTSPSSVDGLAATATEAEAVPFDRQVHKEASLGVEVVGLESASDKIEEMVKASGGFVASNNLNTDASTGWKTADLVVRVPVKDFEATMSALGKMGVVLSKSVTGEDVTEKVSDATSAEQVLTDEVQTATKKLSETRMSDKRTGQKEQELRQMRMHLAQTRARLGLLRKMAALATINVSLTEKPKKPAGAGTTTTPTSGFFSGMQETNRAAMQAFQTAVRVPLVLLIWTLAFSPIWVPLILAYRWASLKTLAQKGAATAAGLGGE